MDEWEDILSRLEDYHAEQNGSPTELLKIIAELIDESGELYADTFEARHALNAVALRLRNMICDDDKKLDQIFQQLTDLLSAWDYAESKGLSFPCVDAGDLETIREERNRLDRELQDREDRIAMLEEEILRLQKECARAKNSAQSAGSEGPQHSRDEYTVPDRNEAFSDPFREVPNHEVRLVDLGLDNMIPTDAPHLGITGTDGGVVCSYTFFNLPVLKTVEFLCPIQRIDANAFYHEDDLALKFQNGLCSIHPHAFSPGTRIIGICAPRGTGANALETYAREHKIPFFPSDRR